LFDVIQICQTSAIGYHPESDLTYYSGRSYTIILKMEYESPHCSIKVNSELYILFTYRTALEVRGHSVTTVDNCEDCLKVYYDNLERRKVKRKGGKLMGIYHLHHRLMLWYLIIKCLEKMVST
jgi:hypothetical protein